jgi:hypothetical protein
MDNGEVKIHGKTYLTVARRIADFREAHADWTISSEVISADDNMVIMKASILNESGRLLSTGFAEEDRNRGQINSTSALENCETSAIGRALSFLGYAGTEIASAEEVANAIQQQTIAAMSFAEAKDILEEHQYPDFFFRYYNDNTMEPAVEAVLEMTALELRAIKKFMGGNFEEEYKQFMRNVIKEAKQHERN